MTKLLHIPSGNFIYFLASTGLRETNIFENSACYSRNHIIYFWIKYNLIDSRGYIKTNGNEFLEDYKNILLEELEIIDD